MGAVTVEAALALCSLVLVLALAIGAVAAVAASVRCLDAARELARLAARGEAERGRAIAAELAPSGARLELTYRGDTVVTEVSVPPLGSLPLPLRIERAVAVAAVRAGRRRRRERADRDDGRRHRLGGRGDRRDHGVAGVRAASGRRRRGPSSR